MTVREGTKQGDSDSEMGCNLRKILYSEASKLDIHTYNINFGKLYNLLMHATTIKYYQLPPLSGVMYLLSSAP